MASDQDDVLATSFIQVDATGNVMLVAGPERRRLRVNSAVLSNASKYFKAMFGPHFQEGQNIDASLTKEVVMPEDNSADLEVICNVIHCRNEDVPDNLSASRIVDVAILADKLDCLEALKYPAKAWLSKIDEVDHIHELALLMAGAYMFDDAGGFSKITMKMMSIFDGSFVRLAEDEDAIAKLLPGNVFHMLDERREHLRRKLQRDILESATPGGSNQQSACTCGWSGQHALAYIDQMRSERLWPFEESISNALKRLDRIGDPPMPSQWQPCGYRWHQSPNFRENRQWQVEMFKKQDGILLRDLKSAKGDAMAVDGTVAANS